MDREPARSFEDLIVWQEAHAFVQLRRAAVSVPASIAEGFKKRGQPDKARLMNVAEGSLEEARYYLRLALDLGYCSKDNLNSDAEEIGRMLGAYARTVLSPSA